MNKKIEKGNKLKIKLKIELKKLKVKLKNWIKLIKKFNWN